MPDGRVFVAWDDGPLEPSPTWTRLDAPGGDFPDQFVSGFDIRVGRQTFLQQTDTGRATVYVNDRSGLFDDRNMSSPYQGKLSGRQILLQILNPVTSTWESQFRGLLNDYTYDINGSAVNADGDPINASIQLEAVDMFDYLAGFGLTPGLAGVRPPVGGDDGVWYAGTTGGVHDRIVEILADANVDPAMYVVASGNVNVQAVKYDPDQKALVALRDCADAEFPFIGNIFCDRYGRFCFRGRYSSFYPDDVAAEPGSDWPFMRWPLGDGKAIEADSARGQLRTPFGYTRQRSDLINVAVCYPANTPTSRMPQQVFANGPSITAYGQHAAPPMSDLLTDSNGNVSGNDKYEECLAFAELLVTNKKDPKETLTDVTLRSIHPDDSRAAATWGPLAGADISDIVNVAVGYPGGTGLVGDSPQDDYYIEGRELTVRPLAGEAAYNGMDDVTLKLNVSRAVWKMDQTGIFPNPFA
jgi:hypothetical protein